MGRIAQALVHPALGGADGDAGLAAQAIEGDADLCAVAGADAVGDDVGEVASVAEVEGGLGDADVGLDADDCDAGLGRELGGDGGDEHGEFGLVVGRGGEEGGDCRDGWAELGRGLGCCVDGDGEGLGVCEEFDGGGYAEKGIVLVFG